jgi:hypothetical protein
MTTSERAGGKRRSRVAGDKQRRGCRDWHQEVKEDRYDTRHAMTG